jgi:hypothetical protein
VKFFFPDSQDQIDPSFDFVKERHSRLRVRQRDDRYAHEVLEPPPYQGLLVSKAMIDRHGGAGRYSAQQRQRFYREGVRDFFRLDELSGPRIETLGDCGAFTYLKDEVPPYGTDEVISFYEQNRFDAGVSVDHLIPAFEQDGEEGPAQSSWQGRFDLTLELAAEFLDRHRERGCSFTPVGVAQGWSPGTYASAVQALQGMGYRRIAIGGLVPLKTPEIKAVLEALGEVRESEVEFHLFGVTRFELLPQFEEYGVTSFDSTSPFRRAFKDGTDNYYFGDSSYVALRVPQVEGNAKLGARIRSGQVSQGIARALEQAALAALRGFDRGDVPLETALGALCEYQELHDPNHEGRVDQYRKMLEDAPWKKCDCAVCAAAGVEVVLFRGSERNKRRGFHNMHVFAQRLKDEKSKVRRAQEKIEALPLAA